MSKFALLDPSNKCISTMITSADRPLPANGVLWDGITPVLGWTWDGSAWVNPPSVSAPAIPTGDFLARFTFSEQIILKELAKTDTGVDTLLDNLRIRASIDLGSDFAAQAKAYLNTLAPFGADTAARLDTIFGA